MKRTWIAAIALLAGCQAYAQTQYEPAIPRGIPDMSGPQSRELAQPAPAPQSVDPAIPRLVTSNDRHRRDADARNCLQLTSNRQIHRCAERYRPRVARSSVARTKAARTARPAGAAAPVARAKPPSDLGKADLSKAASPANPVATAKVVPSPASAPGAGDKPSATPKAAAPEKTAEKTAERPPKWTDGAKAIIKKQGDRLPE